jgi:chromosome partitioning protein
VLAHHGINADVAQALPPETVLVDSAAALHYTGLLRVHAELQMGRVIAVTNLKGGIGKTTTVVNLSAGLALKGAHVLLIDVDAQGNLAMALGVRPRRTLYEVLVEGARVADCLTAARPNLDLLAADESLLMAQPTIAQRPDWPRVLEQAIRPIRASYDFVLIDCGCSLTVLNLNALNAASDVVVPTTVEPFSLKGLETLIKQVTRIKGGTASIQAVVPTLYDPRTRQSGELLEQLRSQYGPLVTEPIRINVRLSEASAQGRTIYEFDPRSRGAADYARLVEQLSLRWGFADTTAPGAAQHTSSLPAPAQAAPSASVPIARAAPLPPAAVSAAPTETQHSAASPATLQGEPPASIDAPRAVAAGHDNDPVVTGAGSMLSLSCPHCGGPLQRATVAGYRVAYCDHCRYRRQELVSGSRR